MPTPDFSSFRPLPIGQTLAGQSLFLVKPYGSNQWYTATVDQLKAGDTFGSGSGNGDGATITYIDQDSDYAVPDYDASEDNIKKNWVIKVGDSYQISVPTTLAADAVSKWINTNGNTFDSTKLNYVFTESLNKHILYSIIKTNKGSAPDETAPTYSIQTITGINPTTASFNVRITESGIVNWILTNSSTPPTKPEILAGTGQVGSNHNSTTVVGGVTSVIALTGLSASSNYYLYSYAEDLFGNETAIQSAISFTTAASDVTAPTFTINSVGSVTDTTALYSARINEAGFVKWMLTTSSSAPTDTQILAGTGQVGSNHDSLTMVANVTNSVTLTGLTGSTNYYLWAYAEDSVGNKTSVQSSVAFTTEATVPTIQNAVWSQLLDATNSGGGNLTHGTSTPAGGTAQSLDVTKPFDIYIDLTFGEFSVFNITESSTGLYTWSDNHVLQGIFRGSTNFYAPQYSGDSSHDLTNVNGGFFIKMTKSGNDIIYSQSVTDGGTYEVMGTATGVLSGKTTMYIQCLFAAGVTQVVNVKYLNV